MVIEKGIRKFFAAIIGSIIVKSKQEWGEKCWSWIILKEECRVSVLPHLSVLKDWQKQWNFLESSTDKHRSGICKMKKRVTM